MTLNEFNEMFPDDDACLAYIFKKKYPTLKGYYRIRKRKCFCNAKGHQIHPLSGTIFHKSSTPLKEWFFVLYLFSQSRHSVAAAEVSRLLGVTDKCAWRMCSKIRSLMVQSDEKLSGTIEVDEAYVGGKRRIGKEWTMRNKTVVLGMVKRKGEIRVKTMKDRSEYSIAPMMKRYIKRGSRIITDEAPVYGTVQGYKRRFVAHGMKEYVRNTTHTNSIESFWSHLKGMIRGTHRYVSKQHLQSYIDVSAFRHNHRNGDILSALLGRI